MLTDAKCKAARASSKQKVLLDANGLELLIVPSGAKIWRFRYRFEAKRKRITIGRYPEMGLAAARSQASKLRGRVWAGDDPDPSAARAQRAEIETIDGVIDSYIEERKPGWKSSTTRTYLSAIGAFRTWVAKTKLLRVDELDARALASFRACALKMPRRVKAKGGTRHDVISTGKRRSADAINCELRAVKTMLQTLRKAGRLPALDRDAIVDNLELLESEQARPSPLTTSKLRLLITACRRFDAKRECEIEPLVLFMLLSGLRLGEALRLRWSEVDLADASILVLAGKTHRERTIDLSVSPALVMLLGRMRGSGDVFGFTQQSALEARQRLIDDFGAPAFLWSTRHSRPGERSAPTLRSTCGCYLTCAPSIFGAASIYRAAAQLGHSVDVAQKHYVNTIRRISATATTVESAMGIEDLLEQPADRRLRLVD